MSDDKLTRADRAKDPDDRDRLLRRAERAMSDQPTPEDRADTHAAQFRNDAMVMTRAKKSFLAGYRSRDAAAQAEIAAQREAVAAWMMEHSFATGHGDTLADLLHEASWQITELWERAALADSSRSSSDDSSGIPGTAGKPETAK